MLFIGNSRFSLLKPKCNFFSSCNCSSMPPSCGQQPEQQKKHPPLWQNTVLSRTGLQVWDVRSIVLTLWLPLVLTFSGERAQPEASGDGRSPAAQTEGETALLWGGLPARCWRLPVLSAPLYPRLQETWVVDLSVWIFEFRLYCILSFTLRLCSHHRQHLIHGGECGLAGPDGARGRVRSGDAGRLLQLRRRWGFADFATARYERAGDGQASRNLSG